MAGIFDQITGQGEAGQTNVESGIESNSFDDAFVGDEVSDEAEPEFEALPTEETPETRTDRRLRDVSQELLRFGLLEESQKLNLYRAAPTLNIIWLQLAATKVIGIWCLTCEVFPAQVMGELTSLI